MVHQTLLDFYTYVELNKDIIVKKKDLLTRYLAWETTFLNETMTTLGVKLKDVVNVTSTWMMLEQGNKVVYIQWAQNNKFVLNFFELMALKNLTVIVTTIIE